MSAKEKSIGDLGGIYTEPKTITLGGIKTDIVDPHHESFPLMCNLSLKEGAPLIVWFVDSHKDLLGKVRACKAKNGRFHAEFFDEILADPMEYAIKYLKIDNFNCPLFYLENITALYHFEPYYKSITAYGRIGKKGEINNPLRACSDEFYIRWADSLRGCDGRVIPDNAGESISPQEFIKDMSYLKYLGPSPFLNIDLDAFLNEAYLSNSSQSCIKERLDWTANILNQVLPPEGIAIARSQTPYEFVPRNRVDKVQKATISKLQKIYP
jgi:hypothetical protein